MKNIILLLLLFCCNILKAQNQKANADSIYSSVDVMPQFPGGGEKFLLYLRNNTHYPLEARYKKIQGKVYMTFVIDKTGSVTNTRIVRGVCPSIDAEALRVINSMPKWTPGYEKGIPVNVGYSVPLSFTLSDPFIPSNR